MVSTDLSNKLKSLLYSLSFTKEEFELVADEVEDINLKSALEGLSLESCQYVKELSLQLKNLGISYPSPSLEDLDGANSMAYDQKETGYGHELMYIIRKSEYFLLNAYRNILSEYFPIPNLRDIILYQQNALKYAFMKVNLLNSARFSL